MTGVGPLTAGCIPRIAAQETLADAVVQVLRIKQIREGMRYKLDISDGESVLSGMLGTQNNELVQNGTLKEGSIIVLKSYVCNQVNQRMIVIILTCEVKDHAATIGNPVPHGSAGPANPVQPQPPAAPRPQMPQQQAPQTLRPQQPMRQYGGHPPAQSPQQPKQEPPSASTAGPQGQFGGRGPVAQSSAMHTSAGGDRIIPIRGLNPYQNRWTIKARIVNKSDVKRWDKGPNNQGQLFSCTLMDSEGTEIRATFFRDAVDKFFEMLQENNVYTFSGGRTKTANRQYSRVDNDFELTFDAHSEIQHVANDSSIQEVNLARVKIADIANRNPGDFVDVLGVAVEIGNIEEFVSKAGKDLVKLEVGIVDESQATIRVTLWGDRSREFHAKVTEMQNPIVGFKGAKISDWGGRTLGTMMGSQILIEPEIPDTATLRQWFEAGGASQNATSLSGRGGGSFAPKKLTERNTIASIMEQNLGNSEKPDVIECKGTIMYIPTDKMWYFACPEEGNNKKVERNADGTWTCEATGQTYNTKENRYIMKASIADFTGSAYVTFFNEQAIEVLGGKTADELETLKEENEAEFTKLMQSHLFHTYVMRLRVKMEEYNDQKRQRCSISSVSKVDYVKESKDLIDAIESYV